MNILVFLYIIFIVVSILAPKSKGLAFVIFVFAALMMGLNLQNPDSDGYMNEYEWAKWDFDITLKLEFGHYYLMKLCNIFHLSFIEYKVIVASITYYLIYFSTIRFTKYSSLIAGLYLLCYLPLDVTQYRNIFAFSIILFGVFYFLLSEKKYGILFYTIIVLIASTIHISCLFYLVFILARYRFSVPLFIVLMVISILVSTYLLINFNSYIDVAMKNMEGKAEEETSIIARIFYISLQVIDCLYLWLIGKKYRKINVDSHIDDFFFRTNLLLLLLSPMYAFDMNFFRLVRNWLLPTMMYIVNRVSIKKSFVAWAPLLFYILFLLWFMNHSATDMIYPPMFYKNVLS